MCNTYTKLLCIVCHACVSECPNNAIYEPGEQWSYSEGTSLYSFELEHGSVIEADTKFDPVEGADGKGVLLHCSRQVY